MTRHVSVNRRQVVPTHAAASRHKTYHSCRYVLPRFFVASVTTVNRGDLATTAPFGRVLVRMSPCVMSWLPGPRSCRRGQRPAPRHHHASSTNTARLHDCARQRPHTPAAVGRAWPKRFVEERTAVYVWGDCSTLLDSDAFVPASGSYVIVARRFVR
jgi:hypothetical protein